MFIPKVNLITHVNIPLKSQFVTLAIKCTLPSTIGGERENLIIKFLKCPTLEQIFRLQLQYH